MHFLWLFFICLFAVSYTDLFGFVLSDFILLHVIIISSIPISCFLSRDEGVDRRGRVEELRRVWGGTTIIIIYCMKMSIFNKRKIKQSHNIKNDC